MGTTVTDATAQVPTGPAGSRCRAGKGLVPRDPEAVPRDPYVARRARLGAQVSAGVRRGLVGQIPAGSRPARDPAEVVRAARTDVQVTQRWRRADARRHAFGVLWSILRHSDWRSMLSRPGHALIAKEVGISPRTVCRMIDAWHELGYLCTLELGTTERIRAGRTCGRDPHAGTGNRAQVYQVCVPVWLDAETAAQTLGQRSDHPSLSSPLGEQGIHETSRLREPHGGRAHARARRSTRKIQDRQARIGHRRRPVQHRRPALWITRYAEVRAVWTHLPAELIERLATHEAERVADEIARQLEHRTPAELADRIARHWEYWRYKAAAIRQPVAVIHRILRRDYTCPDVRCEDGQHLDLGTPCKACALIARERAAACLRAAQGGGHPMPGTYGPGHDSDPHSADERPTPTPRRATS